MREADWIRENLSDGYAGIDSIVIAGEILSQLANFGRPVHSTRSVSGVVSHRAQFIDI